MPEGSGSRQGYDSVLMIAEETTLGTFVTSGATVPFYSENLKNTIEQNRIESLNSMRDDMQIVQAKETCEGSIELDFNPAENAVVRILKQAMGGTVSSLSTGVGIASFAHTLFAGDMENNQSSLGAANIKGLSAWIRRGSVTAGAWGFTGLRVNQLTISGEIGQPVKLAAEMVGIRGSLTAFDITPAFSSQTPVMFNGATVRSAATIGSASSATADRFISFELTLNNNLINDDNAFELGQRYLGVLPPGKRNISLTLTQRFDTTASYSRHIANTVQAVRILMDTGVTITATTGDTTYSASIDLPHCYFGSGQPEVGDAGIITHEVAVQAIRLNTTTNYAIRMTVVNATANY